MVSLLELGQCRRLSPQLLGDSLCDPRVSMQSQKHNVQYAVNP